MQRQRARRASAERARAVHAAGAASGSVPVLVSAGVLRRCDALEAARKTRAPGATGTLLEPVRCRPLAATEACGLARDVAAVAGLPARPDNEAGTGHVTATDGLLVDQGWAPRAKAVKIPPPDGNVAARPGRLRRKPLEGIPPGISGDATNAAAPSVGADGGYSVLAGIARRNRMTSWPFAPKPALLRECNAGLAPLWHCILRHRGIWAPAKLARLLLPLLRAMRKALATALKKRGLIEGEAV